MSVHARSEIPPTCISALYLRARSVDQAGRTFSPFALSVHRPPDPRSCRDYSRRLGQFYCAGAAPQRGAGQPPTSSLSRRQKRSRGRRSAVKLANDPVDPTTPFSGHEASTAPFQGTAPCDLYPLTADFHPRLRSRITGRSPLILANSLGSRSAPSVRLAPRCTSPHGPNDAGSRGRSCCHAATHDCRLPSKPNPA